MHCRLLLLLGTSALGIAVQLTAQPNTDAPPVLRIYREDIKEGRGPAHEKTEARWSQMLSRVNYPANSLAMTSVTGPSQAWFLEAHASFASVGSADAFMEKSPAIKAEEDSLDSQDAEYRSGSRTWLAVFHPEMSYRAKQLMESLPKARYMNVITYRVRPGRDQEFSDIARAAVAALEKANASQSAVVYQIVSGAPNGTYLLFEPTRALSTLDDAPVQSRAFFEALGGESGMKKFMKAVSDVVTGTENVMFAFNSKMSHVSNAFAAVDPDFWMPKPAKAAAPGKPAAKTSAAK